MLVSCCRNTVKKARGLCVNSSRESLRVEQRIPCFSSTHRHASSALHQLSRGPGDQQASSSPSGLRAKPWSFTPDNTYKGTHRGTSVAQYILQLARAVDSNDFVLALKICRKMKEQGVTPNAAIYNHLLHACCQAGLSLETWAILDDMELMGIQPDRQSCHFLINAQRQSGSRSMWEAVDKMTELKIHPNAHTYSLLIARYVHDGNLEMALHLLFEMSAGGLAPDLKTAQLLITLATRVNSPRLALDLAMSFEEGSVRHLGPQVWMNCLIASAEELYMDGVIQCWTKIVQDLNLLPDEGVCIDVLHTAARHGLPELATDVLRVLKLMGASWQEYHFAAVIEAFCRAGQIKDAFLTLNIMRSSDIQPLSGTVAALFEAISKDTDALDAAWSLIDEMIKEEEKVDVLALNVIIQAAVALGDLQRAMGLYKVFADYHAQPTVDTFNLLLSGCVAAGHRELGDRFLADMKEAKIRPDSRTYENIILLCLTQPTYEDAFFYLEEMKAGRHRPTVEVYETLIKKCISVGDTRYSLAVEEMTQCGHQISRELHTIIRNGAQNRSQDNNSHG